MAKDIQITVRLFHLFLFQTRSIALKGRTKSTIRAPYVSQNL